MTWETCGIAVKAGTASALQKFIFYNEPADFDGIWRTQLDAGITDLLSALTLARSYMRAPADVLESVDAVIAKARGFNTEGQTE